MNTPKLGLSALAVISILFSAPVFAVAGKFQFVNGEVQVLDASGKARAVKKGDAVDEGETVSSGTNGFAQIRMEDGGFFAVRPETEFKIDTFKYEGKEDGSEKGIFSLVKGSLRSVTGVVGKKNRDNYKINTATATIGIRGSGADVGHSNSVGTAVRTLFGGHSLTSNGKTVNTGPGQTAMAPPGQDPKFVPNFPFNTSTTGGGENNTGGDGNAGGGNQSNNAAGGNNQQGNSNDNVVIPIVDSEGNLNFTDLTNNGSKIGDSIEGAVDSGVAVVGWLDYGQSLYTFYSFDVVEDGGDFSSSFNGDGALVGWTKFQNGSTSKHVVGNAQLTIDGTADEIGVIWGRWGNGHEASSDYNGRTDFPTAGALAFVTADHITTTSELNDFASWPNGGAGNCLNGLCNNLYAAGIVGYYGKAADSFPTLTNGVAGGSLTDAHATVNFTNSNISIYLAGSGGYLGSWNAGGSSTINDFRAGSLSISGNSVPGAIQGGVKGGFVGTKAEGMIITYTVSPDSGVNTLGGAAALTRNDNAIIVP